MVMTCGSSFRDHSPKEASHLPVGAPLKPAQISPTLCLSVFGSDPMMRQAVFLGVWACQAEPGSDSSKEGSRKELAGN